MCQTSVSILIALMLLLCRDVEATVAASATVPEGATAIDAAAAAAAAPDGLQLCITYCVASTDGALGPLGDAIGTAAAAAAAAAAGDVESTIGPPFPPPPGAAEEPEFARAAAAAANDEAAEREVAVVAAPPPAAPPAAVDVAAVAPAWDIEPSSKSKISDVDSECIGFFIDSPVVAEIEYY